MLLSLLTMLIFPQFKFLGYTPEFCSVFFPLESKRVSHIKVFTENKLPVKINKIRKFVKVCWIKCLPSKIGVWIFLLSYIIWDSSNLIIKKQQTKIIPLKAGFEKLCLLYLYALISLCYACTCVVFFFLNWKKFSQ